MSSSFNLRYWNEAYDTHDMNYPYIKIPNDNFESSSLESENIIRYHKCEKNLIKTKISNDTILKLIQNSANRAAKYPFAYFRNMYFGSNSNDIPEDLITYNTYTYIEFLELATKLSSSINFNRFYTKTVHEDKKLHLVALESSQCLESILTFISSYYFNYTNVPCDENLSGEQLFSILNHSEIESLFCSQNLLSKLIAFLNINKTLKQKLSLTNVIFYEDSNHIDDNILEYLSENNIKDYYVWELIYSLSTKLPNQTIPAQANTPALIIYNFYSNDSSKLFYDKYLNFKAVVLNHHNIIGKVLGYYLYFQSNLSNKSSDIFAISKNLSNLDALCIFLLGIYLNSSVVFLTDALHLYAKDIRLNVCPQIAYLDHTQFLTFYKRMNSYSVDKINLKIENIEDREQLKKYTNLSNFVLGESLKLMIIENQNHISNFQMVKFKFISPFLISFSQGYREETIGSVIFSYLNNLIPGSFGLVLPCYESKLIKDPTDSKQFNSTLRCSTLKIDNLDSIFNTFSGNLLLRGEGLFNSYFKNYQIPSSNIFDKYGSYNYSLLSFTSDKWLKTNLRSVEAKNLSIKILDRIEDIKQTLKIKNINIDFIKSLLINKDLVSVVDDIEIEVDELGYELNIKFKVEKNKWNQFIAVFVKLHHEEVLVTGKFNLQDFIINNDNKDVITIYDKYEDYFLEELSSKFDKLLLLRNCVITFFEKVLEKNYIIGFEQINKIILTTS